MIRELSDFRWPGPIRADLAKRDHSKKCAYHKKTWAYYGAMQESPLLGRKAHKGGTPETVHLLKSQSWGYFPES